MTTEGLIQNQVNLRDIFKVGTAEIMDVQPQMLYYRHGIRFNDQKVIDKYLETDYCCIFLE